MNEPEVAAEIGPEPAPEKKQESPVTARVITGKLRRVQRRHGKRFVEDVPAPPAPLREPVRQPARVAIMLALAHKIQQAIDRGVVRDQADAARRLGITRARVSQLLDLTLLAPEIQERILYAEAVDGVEPMSERTIRFAQRSNAWTDQRQVWRHRCPTIAGNLR